MPDPAAATVRMVNFHHRGVIPPQKKWNREEKKTRLPGSFELVRLIHCQLFAKSWQPLKSGSGSVYGSVIKVPLGPIGMKEGSANNAGRT